MTAPTTTATKSPAREHSVPWFWPFAAAIEMEEAGMTLFRENLKYVAEVEKLAAPPKSEWATANRVLLDLDTMRLRGFSRAQAQSRGAPVLVDARAWLPIESAVAVAVRRMIDRSSRADTRHLSRVEGHVRGA